MIDNAGWNHFSHIIALSVLSALIGSAATSQAGTISANNVPAITVDDEGFSGAVWEYSPAASTLNDLPGRGKNLDAPTAAIHIQGNRADVTINQLEFDPDPFVLNNILITNTTTTTQIYSISMVLPTVSAGPHLISGNVRTDVIDGDDVPGATVAATGGSWIYEAQIDSVAVSILQDAPFSVTAPPRGSMSSSASFSPALSSTPINSSIAIRLHFSLTAGDTASILSRFDATVVPEPASTGLIVASVFAAIGLGRMRSARGRI